MKILTIIKTKSTRSITILFTVVIIISLLFSFIVFWDNQRIHKTLISEYKTDTLNKYKIEAVNYNYNSVFITGWIIQKGQSVRRYNCSVVLHDIENDSYFTIPTEMVKRPDVTALFNDGTYYDNSGFFARVLNNYVNKKSKYGLYLLNMNEGNNTIINTGIIIERK